MVCLGDKENVQITASHSPPLSKVDVFSSAVSFFDEAELGLPTKNLPDFLLLDMMFPVQLVNDLSEPDQPGNLHLSLYLL
jgi:hypothetical protein